MRHTGPMPPDNIDPLQAAAELLWGELQDISAEVTDQVWSGVPSYRAVLLSRQELNRHVEESLRLVLMALLRGSPTIEDLSGPQAMGRDRALQGVPVESMMHSYRSAERAMVDCFTRCFTRFSDDLLLHQQGIRQIQEALDKIETASIDSYSATKHELMLPQVVDTSSFVSSLSAGAVFSTTEMDAVAQSFGVNPNASHIAIAARALSEEGRRALNPIRHHLNSRLLEATQRPILAGQVDDALLFLVSFSESSPVDIQQVLNRALTSAQCRHEVVVTLGTQRDNLADIRVSCNQALDSLEVAARAGYSRQAVSYKGLLVEALLADNRELATILVDHILGPLRGQEHLLSTLEAYFDSRRSTTATAQALIVHKNTVVYRLRRAMTLTGRDLQDTSDVVHFYLALKARQTLMHHSKNA